MPISENARSAEAIHRKLRAIAAVLSDPAATEHERAQCRVAEDMPRKAAQAGSNARGDMDGHPVSVGPGG